MSKESSKTDAMREARERQWEEQNARKKGKPPAIADHTAVGSLDNEPSTPALPAKAKPAKLARASGVMALQGKRAPAAASSSSSDDAEARCAGCGKIRAVRNGKIASHQKGLGKACPGAGKAPS